MGSMGIVYGLLVGNGPQDFLTILLPLYSLYYPYTYTPLVTYYLSMDIILILVRGVGRAG